MERLKITVSGICQGVGFRPFVYGLAHRLDLRGWVRNDASGVTIEVEGSPADVERFAAVLQSDPPSLARIDEVRRTRLAPAGHGAFRIRRSRTGRTVRTRVSPDVATCEACLRELRDPSDRRYRYPFLNCTRCGPRYTIVRELPYDRARTTMADFGLCEACRSEYEDPSDRRFHAQPTACPECGPTLALVDRKGRPSAGVDHPLTGAVERLGSGRIVAVKGLGGYHLACDARDDGAVGTLRARKGRKSKPFAVMVADLPAARALCRVDDVEAEALTSMRRPIVLLRRRPGASVASRVAPGLDVLGLMLPYTPLHHLLLEAHGGPLVLTSGNRSGEPISHRDDEALGRLSEVADAFLAHERPILVPCDDSVVRVVGDHVQPVRRSRGWAPAPIRLPVRAREAGLAVGGHLKNTFCLLRDDEAFLSHHVGDLECVESYSALRDGVSHLCELLDVEPRWIAHDLHPDYLSTKLATELGRDADAASVGVQHHHGHVAACMAEHGEEGPVIGVAFDGTGHGPDGAVWGGEFLLADLSGYERRGHLEYRPLPGGEAAVREPWRMAVSHLEALAEGTTERLRLPFVQAIENRRLRPVLQMVRTGAASPRTSSVGRLFDAAAALVGLRNAVDYRAQAALELEARADREEMGSYPAVLRGEGDGEGWRWDPAPLVQALVDDVAGDVAASRVAARFHNAVCDAVVAGCDRVRRETGCETVVLTGGVFQNAFLTERTVPALKERGFRALIHRHAPPNDGGLALGQAAVAAARRRGSAHRPLERDRNSEPRRTLTAGRR